MSKDDFFQKEEDQEIDRYLASLGRKQLIMLILKEIKKQLIKINEPADSVWSERYMLYNLGIMQKKLMKLSLEELVKLLRKLKGLDEDDPPGLQPGSGTLIGLKKIRESDEIKISATTIKFVEDLQETIRGMMKMKQRFSYRQMNNM